jgi:hypothetical protein
MRSVSPASGPPGGSHLRQVAVLQRREGECGAVFATSGCRALRLRAPVPGNFWWPDREFCRSAQAFLCLASAPAARDETVGTEDDRAALRLGSVVRQASRTACRPASTAGTSGTPRREAPRRRDRRRRSSRPRSGRAGAARSAALSGSRSPWPWRRLPVRQEIGHPPGSVIGARCRASAIDRIAGQTSGR